MDSGARPQPNEVTRITCQVHHRLGPAVAECLLQNGARSVLVETGRSVRQFRRPRPFGLPGRITRLDDQPVEVFRATVDRKHAEAVMLAVISAAGLDQPGRGTIYTQDLVEYRHPRPHSPGDPASPASPTEVPDAPETTLLKDLSLVTCILSMAGSGEQVARVALDLGTCVPVVTLGTGTGMRDRLGLLRITVPPEKEIVHLLVPVHDAEAIIRVLIDEANLSQPGRGFVYETPVKAGVLDRRLRIGPQEYAASIEQIIAAIDHLTAGTAWRKRFIGVEGDETDRAVQLSRNNREITLICAEGRAENLVEVALEAGAGGATTSRARRLTGNDPEEGIAARERSTISVPAEICERVVAALLDAEQAGEESADRIQVLDAPAAFTHSGRA